MACSRPRQGLFKIKSYKPANKVIVQYLPIKKTSNLPTYFLMILIGFCIDIPQVSANPSFLEGNNYQCGGYARAGYINTDIENTSSEQAGAMGGSIACSITFQEFLTLNLGGFTSIDPGINSNNDDRVHGDFFDADKNSYALLGLAYISIHYEKFDTHLGRQVFDSPHMDSDDLRMVPNLFQAYLVDYQYTDQIEFGAGYIHKASGWENGADQSEFINVGRGFSGKGEGAWVAWSNYEHNNFSGSSWFYNIKDNVNILYTELFYGQELGETLSYELGFQYELGRETGAEYFGKVDADTFGVTGAVTWEDLTVIAGYNHNFGDSGALPSLGGGPFFTSMEDQTLDAVDAGKDARAVVVRLEYGLLDGLTVGTAVADFSASSNSDYHKVQHDIYAYYELADRITLESIIAHTYDKVAGDDLQQYRIILTYHF